MAKRSYGFLILFFVLQSLGLTGQQAQAQRLNHVNMARMMEMSYALPKPCRWGKWVCAPLKNKDSMLGAMFYQPLDLSQIIIALGGAITDEDWMMISRLRPTTYVAPGGTFLEAHEGYYTRALSVADALQQVIEHLALKKSDLFFIGHSQGGAIASVLATFWVQEGFPIKELITLGSPYAGDQAFNEALATKVPVQSHYVIVNDPSSNVINWIVDFIALGQNAQVKAELKHSHFLPYDPLIKLVSFACPQEALSGNGFSASKLFSHGIGCYVKALNGQ